MSNWKPIEECPSDVQVLLYCPHLNQSNEERIEVGKYRDTICGTRHAWATHWQPLPTPPVEAKLGGLDE